MDIRKHDIISPVNDTKISIEEILSHPEKIDFAFQPIFQVATGEIFGYEALMRPYPYTPIEVITECAKQNRLNEIEEITTYYGAKHFLENNLTGKLFLNSFPAAFVSDEMMVKVHQLVQNRLKKRLVIEILEYTEFNKLAHDKKTFQFEKSKTGESIAIDDYGTGKNIDKECIEFYKPDIVKIDRTLISGIHQNTTNQKALIDICSYLRKNNITILAEGVETQDEYDYLKKYPIELMQGFFLGKPTVFDKNATS